MHGCRRRRGLRLFGFFLVFFVCISTPHPFPPFLVFSPLPDSSQWTQWPCLQDPGCPHFCAQIRTGETVPRPQDLAFGQLGRFWFLINKSQWERKSGACLSIGWAPAAACCVRCRPQRCGQRSGAAFRACPQAPSGLARGQSSPSPHSSGKAVKSRARRGLRELQEQRSRAPSGWGRLPGGEPRAARGMDAASLCPTLLS